MLEKSEKQESRRTETILKQDPLYGCTVIQAFEMMLDPKKALAKITLERLGELARKYDKPIFYIVDVSEPMTKNPSGFSIYVIWWEGMWIAAYQKAQVAVK